MLRLSDNLKRYFASYIFLYDLLGVFFSIITIFLVLYYNSSIDKMNNVKFSNSIFLLEDLYKENNPNSIVLGKLSSDSEAYLILSEYLDYDKYKLSDTFTKEDINNFVNSHDVQIMPTSVYNGTYIQRDGKEYVLREDDSSACAVDHSSNKFSIVEGLL